MERDLKRFYIITILFVACVISPRVNAQEQYLHVETDPWSTTRIAEGVTWHSYHGADYFNSSQSINLLQVDLNRPSTAAQFSRSDSTLTRTSVFAKENGALAAINGSYFDMSQGGSVVFFKVDGELIHPGSEHRRRYTENGAIGMNDVGRTAILKRPGGGWRQSLHPSLLSSGPLLIHDGEVPPFNKDPFHQNRHPRTAVGITHDQQLLLVTVDGRSDKAHGMTIPELAELMDLLGSHSALNLDGGGSTTMWIDGRGIVNYPSDNGEFDHKGERKVANVFLIKKVK